MYWQAGGSQPACERRTWRLCMWSVTMSSQQGCLTPESALTGLYKACFNFYVFDYYLLTDVCVQRCTCYSARVIGHRTAFRESVFFFHQGSKFGSSGLEANTSTCWGSSLPTVLFEHSWRTLYTPQSASNYVINYVINCVINHVIHAFLATLQICVASSLALETIQHNGEVHIPCLQTDPSSLILRRLLYSVCR